MNFKEKKSVKINIVNNIYSLISAVEANNIELVKQLIGNGIDVNKRGPETFTPLHVAAYHNRPDIIYILWENGAYLDPTLDGGKLEGFTPLHLAVQKNHLKCVKVLLNLGASVIPQTEGIYHPIHYAVFNNFVDVTCELLQHGADANVRFNNKFFEENPVTMECSLWLDHDLPLSHYAILQKLCDIFDMLTFFSCKNLKTSLGKTTLMQAVEISSVKWVEFLATKENVNNQDNFGQPVLHFTVLNANTKASKYSKEEVALYPVKSVIVKILVKKGADVNAQFPENKERSSVIHYMIKYGFFEGVKYLLFYNSDLNFNEIDTFTLLSLRVSNKYLSPDMKNDRDHLIQLNRRYTSSIYLIIKKAIQLQMIGMPVDENLILKRSFYSWISTKEHMEIVNFYKNEINQELTDLKETKVGDTSISIWDLLTCGMNKLVKLMSYECVKNFDVKNYAIKIFHYRWILGKRLQYAKNRKLFLEKKTEEIATLLINYIPFDCCEQISSLL